MTTEDSVLPTPAPDVWVCWLSRGFLHLVLGALGERSWELIKYNIKDRAQAGIDIGGLKLLRALLGVAVLRWYTLGFIQLRSQTGFEQETSQF